VIECVSKLGSKVPVYAALVGLVNIEIPDYGKKVNENATESASFVWRVLTKRNSGYAVSDKECICNTHTYTCMYIHI
jgi:hypothetical protein